MNAKQYLKQAYRLNDLIDSDLAELQSLRDLSLSIPSPNTNAERVSGSNASGSRIEGIISKIVDLENEINEEINKFVNLKGNIRRAISQMQNQDEQLLLRLRYIELLSWNDIQERMGFDDIRRTYQIHADALKHFRVPG